MAYKYLNDEGLKALVKKIKSYVSGLLPTQKVTWAELKALRDGGKLTAGRKYRITDFVTTSAQAETRSAGHAFDVIVTADDEKTLNENAHAAIHSGDTYFAGCKLNAWELKYSLDNDVERFAWADATNGKGVVWWMRDEWDNECFYDFKNIQYKRYKVTAVADEDRHSTFLNGYYGIEGGFRGVEVSDTDFKWAYTFSVLDVDKDSNDIIWDADYPDASILQGGSNDPDGGGYLYPILRCEKNRVDALEIASIVDDSETTVKYALNDGVFFSKYKWFETDGGTYRHELEHCAYNRFGNSHSFTLAVCCGNKTGTSCYEFLCGNNCDSWICGNDCASWTCGNNCYYWTCGNDCDSWSCGNDCDYWTCGNDCYSWSCGNRCDSWTCGNDCDSWICGNDCDYWTCGNNCDYWTCGNDCDSWSCGNDCDYWTCGNRCNSWTCGNEVSGTKVLQDFVSYFRLESGVNNITIKSSGTPTYSTPLKNFVVKAGVKGVSSSSKTAIVIDAASFPPGSDYEWIIAKNSKGEIKQYCEADLIN